jgi:hypothetical protein
MSSRHVAIPPSFSPAQHYREGDNAFHRRCYKKEWLRECWQRKFLLSPNEPHWFYGVEYEDLVGVFAAIELKLQEIYDIT